MTPDACPSTGLGDIAPTTQAGRGFAIVHMAVSVVLFATIIGTILRAHGRRSVDAKRLRLIERQLDEELIVALDRDGNGVDKAEYVLGMLTNLGLLSQDDYMPFVKQFDALDKTGDGLLTTCDLRDIARSNRVAMEEAQKRLEAEAGCPAAKAYSLSLELIAPTALACMGYVWNLMFGYLLLVGGLIGAVGIGLVLRGPMDARTARLAAAVQLVAAAFVPATLTLNLLFIFDAPTYIRLDPLTDELVYGYLDDSGRTVLHAAAVREEIDEHLASKLPEKGTALEVIYTLIFAWLMTLQLRAAYHCLQAARAQGEHRDTVHKPRTACVQTAWPAPYSGGDAPS